MRLISFCLLWSFFAAVGPLASGQVWKPASSVHASLQGSVNSLDSFFDDAVRLVGAVPPAHSEKTESRKVFGVEVSDTSIGEVAVNLSPPDEAVPVDAFWPDSSDQITLYFPGKANAQAGLEIRNPWEVRLNMKSLREEMVITCGGIIGAHEDGYVAFLNGRVFRQGATLGEFTVFSILANEVILERNGSYAVIPRGRRVTVITSVS